MEILKNKSVLVFETDDTETKRITSNRIHCGTASSTPKQTQKPQSKFKLINHRRLKKLSTIT